MILEETFKQLMNLKLYGMATALREFLERPAGKDTLTFEEHVGMLVGREWDDRQNRRLKNRLAQSKLRESACIEDIDYRHPRALDRSVIQRLASCQWVREHENVLITGATGIGKTWLACALVQRACRNGFTALYQRIPRLLPELAVARGIGTYPKAMERLAKQEVLVLDDFGLAPLSDMERRDLLEVIEDRQNRRATIVTSQLAIKHWHEVIGEPTIADAIMDRLISNAHRIELSGKVSLRPEKRPRKEESKQ